VLALWYSGLDLLRDAGITHSIGGTVEKAERREYGRAQLKHR